MVLCSRQHVTRSSSAAALDLAALLGRTSKQKPSQPKWLSSKGSASQEFQSPANASVTATQAANCQPVTEGPAINMGNCGGVSINATKPDLLTQIQAIRLQEHSAATDAGLSAASHEQQADDRQGSCQIQPQEIAPGQMPMILDPHKALQQQMLFDMLAIQ